MTTPTLPAAGLSTTGQHLLQQINAALGWLAAPGPWQVGGHGGLPSVCAVTDLATASVAAAGLAVAALAGRRSGAVPAVQVDRTLACRWFSRSIEPTGWSLPPAWDDLAGDYTSADGGWIRLHTNAPQHRQAALRALGLAGAAVDKTRVAQAVLQRQAAELEAAVVAEGGCAAEMRSAAAWQQHPQGRAVAAEPLIAWAPGPAGQPMPAWPLAPDRPLAGVRVLDLTRILAGPVATRCLAGHGAQVLRLDPPGWDEPAVAPDVTLGKRRARLDLHSAAGRAQFEQLLAGADVLVHGYRADALEALGLGTAWRQQVNPALVDVALNAYGWTGPWMARRGFDSLVQMSSGIAEAGMRLLGKPVPTPLPVQALDHATGYLMAAAVVQGLARRLDQGCGSSARLSLARTAALLLEAGPTTLADTPPLPALQDSDCQPETEHTAWGPARRLRAPAEVAGAPARWDLPAGPLGDGLAAW